MKDRQRFSSTMLSLAAALKMYGKELTTATQEVYWTALGDLTDEEFQRAAALLIRRETEFPPPVMFLDVIRPSNPTADASRALARAWELGKQVIPGQGCWWSGDAIREKVGPAAYEAFHACGGSSAFQNLDSEYHGPRIRRDFIEAYQSQVAAGPQRALPAPTAPLLTTGQILLEAEAVKVGTLDAVRAEFLAQAAAERAAIIASLTKPEPLPVPTAEEQEALDRLGEKIAAKKRELAAQTSTGDTP